LVAALPGQPELVSLISSSGLQAGVVDEKSMVGWQQKRCKTTIDKAAWIWQCVFKSSIDLISLVELVYS
jgi:hypothetical protein